MHCTNTVDELTPLSSSTCLRHLWEMSFLLLSSSCCLQNLHVLFLSSPEDISDDSDKDAPASAEMIWLGMSRHRRR